MKTNIVYLLHFDRPISPKHTCQHYIGSAEDLETRIAEHRAGRGARLTQVAAQRGIQFTVVRTWPGGRTLERKLKDQHGRRLCPICADKSTQPPAAALLFTLADVPEMAF